MIPRKSIISGVVRQSFRLTTIGLLGVVLLSGCAAERLRDNTRDAGAITIDVTYEMVLTNIAMIRYYRGASVLPSDYRITAGQVAVNDNVGITAGATLGGIHGIIVPSVQIPTSRVLQQQLNVSPTQSVALLMALQPLYQKEEQNHHSLFHDGPVVPVGVLCGSYRGYNVWVNPSDSKAIAELTRFTTEILGGDHPYAKKGPEDIFDLRKDERKGSQGANGQVQPLL